ncbi:hypothetical protein Vadar_000239 [Vaccinium darrowii]|uniref:Uncharacterized protein n=1 Tax=Vaccinium darrowii TaxID=229202 RepID=A0ACB7XVH7_9ERIC|nr:hypothetical protein Vadar_000239 [Vaccinium darrowii]
MRINEALNNKSWKPIKVANRGPFLSHCFFADDIVLFGKATRNNCHVIKNILEDFCSQSGQRISSAKSKVLFSKNVGLDDRVAYANILSMPIAHSFGQYLGCPILDKRPKKADFKSILDKIHSKLAGWKSKIIPMSGRTVLINSVNCTIPAYVMQNNMLPKGVQLLIREKPTISGIPWCTIFPFTCWNIWLLRNKTLFQSSNARDTIESTIKASVAEAIEWHFVASPERTPRSKNVVMIKWLHPPPGSFKLNTDGAFKGSLGQATGGGLIRDDKGNWIVGFHRSFRALQGLEAEFWALRDGLLLAQNKRLVPLKVEMDALAAIQLISDSNQTRHFLSNIIHDCRCLMRQLGVVKIDHAYREGNKCADLLASMSFNDDLDFHVFDVAPACINSQLGDDLNGAQFPRLLRPWPPGVWSHRPCQVTLGASFCFHTQAVVLRLLTHSLFPLRDEVGDLYKVNRLQRLGPLDTRSISITSKCEDQPSEKLGTSFCATSGESGVVFLRLTGGVSVNSMEGSEDDLGDPRA